MGIGFVGYSYYQNSSGLFSIVPLVHHAAEAFCMLTAEGRYPFARMLYMNINLQGQVFEIAGHLSASTFWIPNVFSFPTTLA